MAVVSFKWIHEGRGGGDTIEGEVLRTRVARVSTDNNNDAESVILAACNSNGAALGAAHPDGSGAYLQRRDPQNISASKVVWIVTCHYSNKILDNPLNEPAKIKVSGQLFSAPILFDADNKLIVNSAGQPLVDPAPEADFPRRLVSVTKNIATPTAADPIFALENTLNQQVVTIWPTYGTGLVIGEKKAKLRDVDVAGPEERNGITYFVLSLTIDWRSEGWDDPLLNAGNEYRDASGKFHNSKKDDGTEPGFPWPLDSAGNRLTSAQIQASGVLTITPKRYFTVSWAALIALI
jgi:hypothetical protein